MNQSNDIGAERGFLGEEWTAEQIQKSKLFEQSEKLLRNVYIPDDKGSTSEVDIIWITKKGIFVFENKNYGGIIHGNDEKYTNWLNCNHKKQFLFYSPVKQNQAHIKYLRTFLGQDVFCYSFIVFPMRCTLGEINYSASNTLVTKSDELATKLDRLERTLPDVLTDEQINLFYRKLSPRSGKNVPESVKQKHIDDLSQKYEK